MLNIESIEEFRWWVMHKEEMREAEIGHACRSFCYMISAASTFDSAWAQECRGIVFNEFGQVNGRPLHKFFNVNERPASAVDNLDWCKVVRVMDKRDGSMIHTVDTPDGMLLKSKKTFESEVAIAATKWAMQREEYVQFFDLCKKLNRTAIFEWTAPDARIVLYYAQPMLTLLHMRHNVTGEYTSPSRLKTIAAEWGIPVVDEVDEFFDVITDVGDDGHEYDRHMFNINAMLDAVHSREDVEGWIVQFADGIMVKVKTDWYMKRHRAMTFVRERDIAQLVLDEGLDDMKSMLVAEGVDISDILSIEERVLEDIRKIAHDVESRVGPHRHLSRKDFAVMMTGAEHFGLMMSAFIGKEPDYKGYFERNMLKENYSLRQLVMVPTTAEVD